MHGYGKDERMAFCFVLLSSFDVSAMCAGGGINMITDVLYSANIHVMIMYIFFCVKRYELSHVMAIAL